MSRPFLNCHPHKWLHAMANDPMTRTVMIKILGQFQTQKAWCGVTVKRKVAATQPKYVTTQITLLPNLPLYLFSTIAAAAASRFACNAITPVHTRYIMRVTKQYPGCRTLAGGGPLSVEPEGPPEGGVGPSTHQKLLHK